MPAPKQLTLERQLNKSILIRWNGPEDSPSHCIDSYHVYVDGVLKTTVKANERTKALLEGVDSNKVIINLCKKVFYTGYVASNVLLQIIQILKNVYLF